MSTRKALIWASKAFATILMCHIQCKACCIWTIPLNLQWCYNSFVFFKKCLALKADHKICPRKILHLGSFTLFLIGSQRMLFSHVLVQLARSASSLFNVVTKTFTPQMLAYLILRSPAWNCGITALKNDCIPVKSCSPGCNCRISFPLFWILATCCIS